MFYSFFFVTVSNVQIFQNMTSINVTWVVTHSILMMQFKVISYRVAVQTVNAKNLERLLKLFALTLNVPIYLKNTIQNAYRSMIIWTTAAVHPKYAVNLYHHLKYFYIFSNILFIFGCKFFIDSKIDQEKIRSLKTCEVDGRTYRHGERIYPENACYTCHCVDGYNNVTSHADNPNCSKVNCGMELQMNNLREGCVPVYYKTPNCCAIDHKCRKFLSSFFDP